MPKKIEVKGYAGDEEKRPEVVNQAATLIHKLYEHAGIKSSYKKSAESTSAFPKMDNLAEKEIRYGVLQHMPKEFPPVVFVGTKEDLSKMRVAFNSRDIPGGWDMYAQSAEGDRTFVILNNKVFADQNVKGMTHPVNVDNLNVLTGEQIPLIQHPADLVVVLVGARLHQSGEEFGSINAYYGENMSSAVTTVA